MPKKYKKREINNNANSIEEQIYKLLEGALE
jgi:hypothetical protein